MNMSPSRLHSHLSSDPYYISPNRYQSQIDNLTDNCLGYHRRTHVSLELEEKVLGHPQTWIIDIDYEQALNL